MIQPLVTEKTLKEAALGRYTFIVGKNATKPEIARLVGDLYGVKVIKVRTTVIPGKSRRIGVGAKRSLSSDRKKATVTLAKDQKIDIYEVPKEEPQPKKEEKK